MKYITLLRFSYVPQHSVFFFIECNTYIDNDNDFIDNDLCFVDLFILIPRAFIFSSLVQNQNKNICLQDPLLIQSKMFIVKYI